ncbi:MAG TPA: hypothetical protein PKW43_04975 [Deltaproteobacteria bacterium]|nr:hypothetical protein [Deltaproteobacteria bacterium]
MAFDKCNSDFDSPGEILIYFRLIDNMGCGESAETGTPYDGIRKDRSAVFPKKQDGTTGWQFLTAMVHYQAKGAPNRIRDRAGDLREELGSSSEVYSFRVDFRAWQLIKQSIPCQTMDIGNKLRPCTPVCGAKADINPFFRAF